MRGSNVKEFCEDKPRLKVFFDYLVKYKTESKLHANIEFVYHHRYLVSLYDSNDPKFEIFTLLLPFIYDQCGDLFKEDLNGLIEKLGSRDLAEFFSLRTYKELIKLGSYLNTPDLF